MLSAALVMLGSALGGIARYACSGVVARWAGETFPLGTLVVNIAGSFLIGFFAAMGAVSADAPARDLLIVGFCGGYTTFSSFSLQTLSLAREAEWSRVAGNLVLSVGLCLASVWLGFAAATAIGS